MKKLLAMLLAAMMVFTVVGCEQKTEEAAPATDAPVATEAPADVEGEEADAEGEEADAEGEEADAEGEEVDA